MKNRLIMLALAFALAAPAASFADDMNPPNGGPTDSRGMRPDKQRPTLIPNDTRSNHRRQSAKCMNAYPDDHSGFSSCMQGERQGGKGNRPQFMPIPGSSANY